MKESRGGPGNRVYISQELLVVVLLLLLRRYLWVSRCVGGVDLYFGIFFLLFSKKMYFLFYTAKLARLLYIGVQSPVEWRK